MGHTRILKLCIILVVMLGTVTSRSAYFASYLRSATTNSQKPNHYAPSVKVKVTYKLNI